MRKTLCTFELTIWSLDRSIVNDGGLLKCFENKAVTPADCTDRLAFSESDRAPASGAQAFLASIAMASAFTVIVITLNLAQ